MERVANQRTNRRAAAGVLLALVGSIVTLIGLPDSSARVYPEWFPDEQVKFGLMVIGPVLVAFGIAFLVGWAVSRIANQHAETDRRHEAESGQLER